MLIQPETKVADEPPSWFQPERVVLELDAAILLAAGEHPLARIRQTLAQHPAGATVVVASTFEPAPLLEHLGAEGVLGACCRVGDGFRTYLSRPA